MIAMSYRYAIFSVRFDPLVGGVESFTLNLARELVRQGNDVVVVTKRITDAPEIENRTDGITVVRLPTISLVNDRLPLSLRNRRHKRLLELVRSMNIDRVLVNNRFYPHSIDGLRFARSISAPALMLDHGSAYLTLGNPVADFAIKLYEHGITQRAKAFNPVFCGISAKSAEWLKTFGIDTNYVIHNSIDAEAFRADASRRAFREELGVSGTDMLVAFVGRLTPEKGCDIFVRAARMLESGPFVFALAGDGVMRGDLEAMACENTRFLGLINRQDLSALMRDADIFCLPSRSEGFCTSLLEASAWGTPSVITDVGGAAEVIGSQADGIIIEEMADAAVLEGIESMVGNGMQGLHDMGSRVRANVEQNCSWHATVSTMERVFEQAENGRNA